MGKHRETITDLYELGLLYGDTLTYLCDNDIKVSVVDNNKVSYKNINYTLSGITNFLKDNNQKYNGWDFWIFNNMTISDRRKLYKKHKTMKRMKQITSSKT